MQESLKIAEASSSTGQSSSTGHHIIRHHNTKHKIWKHRNHIKMVSATLTSQSEDVNHVGDGLNLNRTPKRSRSNTDKRSKWHDPMTSSVLFHSSDATTLFGSAMSSISSVITTNTTTTATTTSKEETFNLSQRECPSATSATFDVVNQVQDFDMSVYEEHLKPMYRDGDVVLDVECGKNQGLLYLSRLCQGSKGPCILFNEMWLTPNEFQYVSGRETAKDWKRSIRHHGKSMKLLLAKGILAVHPPICDCDGCRISSPVNRGRLAEKRISPPSSTSLEYSNNDQHESMAAEVRSAEDGLGLIIPSLELGNNLVVTQHRMDSSPSKKKTEEIHHSPEHGKKRENSTSRLTSIIDQLRFNKSKGLKNNNNKEIDDNHHNKYNNNNHELRSEENGNETQRAVKCTTIQEDIGGYLEEGGGTTTEHTEKKKKKSEHSTSLTLTTVVNGASQQGQEEIGDKTSSICESTITTYKDILVSSGRGQVSSAVVEGQNPLPPPSLPPPHSPQNNHNIPSSHRHHHHHRSGRKKHRHHHRHLQEEQQQLKLNNSRKSEEVQHKGTNYPSSLERSSYSTPPPPPPISTLQHQHHRHHHHHHHPQNQIRQQNAPLSLAAPSSLLIHHPHPHHPHLQQHPFYRFHSTAAAHSDHQTNNNTTNNSSNKTERDFLAMPADTLVVVDPAKIKTERLSPPVHDSSSSPPTASPSSPTAARVAAPSSSHSRLLHAAAVAAASSFPGTPPPPPSPAPTSSTPGLDRFSPASFGSCTGTPILKQMEQMMTRNYSDFMRSLAAKYNNSNPSESYSYSQQVNGFMRNFDGRFPFKTATPPLTVLGIKDEGNRKSENHSAPPVLGEQRNANMATTPSPLSVMDLSSTQALINMMRSASAHSASQLENYLRGSLKRPLGLDTDGRADPLDLTVNSGNKKTRTDSLPFDPSALSLRLHRGKSIRDFRDLFGSLKSDSEGSDASCDNNSPKSTNNNNNRLWASPLLDGGKRSPVADSPGSVAIKGISTGDAPSSGDQQKQQQQHPCLSACTERACGNSTEVAIIANWTVEDVCKFVAAIDTCSEYVETFREQSIDGAALPLLTEEHLINNMNMKLGPALKFRATLAKKIGHCAVCMHCIHCHGATATGNGTSNNSPSSINERRNDSS